MLSGQRSKPHLVHRSFILIFLVQLVLLFTNPGHYPHREFLTPITKLRSKSSICTVPLSGNLPPPIHTHTHTQTSWSSSFLLDFHFSLIINSAGKTHICGMCQFYVIHSLCTYLSAFHNIPLAMFVVGAHGNCLLKCIGWLTEWMNETKFSCMQKAVCTLDFRCILFSERLRRNMLFFF
jgi:hypothetical protein